MVFRRLSIFGLISAAAIVSGVLVGCGGSSASVAGFNPTVTATGGVPVTVASSTGTTTTSVPASSSPQQVQVTTTGGTVIGGPGGPPAVVPPGQPAITSSTTIGVIPASIPFINGLQFAPSSHRAPTAHPLNISYDAGLHWTWTGCNVNNAGDLDAYLILTPGAVWLQAVGPFVLITSSGFHISSLTMQQLIFGIVVDTDGIPSIPTDLHMRIPANGGTTAGGNFVNVSYFTPNFATGTGKLILTGLASGTKTQTKAVVAGNVNFADPTADSQDHVPSTGVNTVEYLYSK
jgi:hypothetical protein